MIDPAWNRSMLGDVGLKSYFALTKNDMVVSSAVISRTGMDCRPTPGTGMTGAGSSAVKIWRCNQMQPFGYYVGFVD